MLDQTTPTESAPKSTGEELTELYGLAVEASALAKAADMLVSDLFPEDPQYLEHHDAALVICRVVAQKMGHLAEALSDAEDKFRRRG